MLLWLEGDFIYSGMEFYFGWREIVYTAAWNVIMVGNVCIYSGKKWYCGWWQIVYTAYRMILRLKGDGVYIGMELYCGWMEILYTAVMIGIVAGGRLYIQR